MKFFAGLVLLLIVDSSWALPHAMTLQFPAKIEAPRWQFDAKKIQTLKGPALAMAKVKTAYTDGNAEGCLKIVQSLYAQAVGLTNWLLVKEGQCAQLIAKDKVRMQAFNKWLKRLQSDSIWLHDGPQADSLREIYIQILLRQFKLQIQFDRKQAWLNLEKLSSLMSWLGPQDRFEYFKLAGELAFLEQSQEMARAYLTQALHLREDSEIRARLESISKKPESSNAVAVEVPSPDPDLGITDGERQLLDQMRSAIRIGDLLAAIEDGVLLIRKFSGGERARWASDRILEIYLELAGRADEKYIPIRGKAVDRMMEADGSRLYRWANNAYAKGYYEDALKLADASFERLVGLPDSTKSLALVAASALAAGKYDRGVKAYENLVVQHFGSPESVEALFRLGLIRYRKGDYASAASFMERLLALPETEDYEYRALYWQWRALQKSKSELAAGVVNKLISKYPVSLYGLKAKAELNNNQLSWDKKNKLKVSSDIWMTASEQQSFERLQSLLKAGWFEEAQEEMARWPLPRGVEEKLIRAQWHVAAFDYQRGFDLIQQVWSEKSDWTDWSILQMIYPREYSDFVRSEAKSNDIDPALIWSVIRQESSFATVASSPSNAYGLMQVIGPTANEVAKQLRFKEDLKIPENLFEPAINIRIGSHYLTRLIRGYKGHIPLALAAYNAGPGRIRKWLASRTELGQLESTAIFSVETDLWVDELPWSETSFYVKAVLRNFLIYRLQDGNNLKLEELVKR